MSIALLHSKSRLLPGLERFLGQSFLTQTFQVNPREILCEMDLLPAGSYFSEDPLFFSMEDVVCQKIRDSIGSPVLADRAIEFLSSTRLERVLESVVVVKSLVQESIPMSVFNSYFTHEHALPRHVLVSFLKKLKPHCRSSSQPLSLFGGQNVIPVMPENGCLSSCTVSSLTIGDGKWIFMPNKEGTTANCIPAGRTLVFRSRLSTPHLVEAPWF